MPDKKMFELPSSCFNSSQTGLGAAGAVCPKTLSGNPENHFFTIYDLLCCNMEFMDIKICVCCLRQNSMSVKVLLLQCSSVNIVLLEMCCFNISVLSQAAYIDFLKLTT